VELNGAKLNRSEDDINNYQFTVELLTTVQHGFHLVWSTA